MNVKRKRCLTYSVIALFNFCTGLGYAIVFPTVWNYVHKRFGGTGAMLGLIISSYSISSFFSNLILGIWADKTQNTKCILAVAVLMEIAGSFMYFLGISTWFLVISRLIAGFGGGGGAAVLADITRTTSESERTSILAVVVSFRQLGLVIGPALNLFLSNLHSTIGQFSVDKYTSPGLFMAILWSLVELTVLGLYFNLTILKRDEHLEQLFPGYNTHKTICPADVTQSGETDYSSAVDTGWNSLCDSPLPSGRSVRTMGRPRTSSGHNVHSELLNEFEDTSDVNKVNISTIVCKNTALSEQREKTERVKRTHSVSDTMIESAERFIQSSEVGGSRENVPSIPQQETSLEHNLGSSVLPGGQPVQDSSLAGIMAEERTDDDKVDEERMGDEKTDEEKTNEERTSEERRFSSRRSGFFRDEVVVLLSLAFISSFSQTVLETVVTPLAQRYYHFDEMENSFIYLLAGIEVILVFCSIKYCSKKLSDRVLLIFGISSMCLAMAIPLTFVPFTKPGEMTTLPYFIFTIVIDLIGIAIIVICSTSLLSKLTSEERQAFSQGIRRSMISLGCILGPLWGGAYLNKIYLLFSIPLAVSLLIGLLFVCSYRKLKL